MHERLWEIHVQPGVLVATAFSDFLCFGVPRCCVAPYYTLAWPTSSEWQNRHTVDPDLSLEMGHLIWVNSLQMSVHCAFLWFQVCYLSFPLHIGVYVCQLEAAQHKPKGLLRGLGVWRVEVHLAGHFGGLVRCLVVAVGRAVRGAICVGAAMLVVSCVAAAAAALGVWVGDFPLVGVWAGAVSLAGVGAGAVAVEGGDAGARGGAGADQAGHAGSRNWEERRRRRRF